MLSENLVNLRKAKGLSQEAVATQLHVVRQTVSKWEKGLSVPDAHVLVALSELFGVTVNELLGASDANAGALDEVAQQLYLINEQLAVKNRRAQQIWNLVRIILFTVIGIYVVVYALLFAIMMFNVSS